MSTPFYIEKKSSCTQTTETKNFFPKHNQYDNNNSILPVIHPSLHTIKYQMLRDNKISKAPKVKQSYFNILKPKILIKNELNPHKNLSTPMLTNVRHKSTNFLFQNEEIINKIKPDANYVNSNGIKHINKRKREDSPIKEGKIKEKHKKSTNNSNSKMEKDSTLNQIKSLLYQKIKNTEISNKNKNNQKFSNHSCQSIEETTSTNRKILYYGKFFLLSQNNIQKKLTILKKCQQIIVDDNKPKSQANCYNLRFPKGNKFFITNNPYKHDINSISVDNINKNKHEGRNVRDQKYLSL